LAPEVFLHVDVASSTVKLDAGDVVCLRDSLGRRRRLTLLDEHGLAAARKTTRLLSQTSLKLKRSGSTIAVGRVADLGTVPKEATLAKGEVFLLRLGPGPSLPEKRDKLGNVLTRARIGCTWPEALAQLAVGHRVLLDDGRVAARVLEIHEDSAHLEVENVGRTDASGRAALKGERGLNLPDTPLPHVGLTPADSLALSRMAPFVDIVQLSFVQEAADILQVDEALVEFPKIGVIAKIETDAAVRNLPSILSALHVRESAGVLIARGDLALECGFERLTELQEEILWLAEAAHLPVVWATQVLESLVKNGVRSRAEMTDASRAVLAEAVMLNKGPYVAEALGVLRDLAVRVSGHQEKRRHLLRPLSIATWASRSH
jgi:pyruvate kinase